MELTKETVEQYLLQMCQIRAFEEQAEKSYIEQVLQKHRWHRGRAAETLGINRKTLFKKLKQHSLSKASN